MEKFEKAVEFAEEWFKDKRSVTGEPYVQHYHRVVQQLKDHGLDHENLLVAALLHDVYEDTNTEIPEIQNLFGKRTNSIARTFAFNKRPNLPKLKESFETDDTFETFEAYVDDSFMFYKSFFYMGIVADLYTVFIKMSDQLARMTAVGLSSEEETAQELQDIQEIFLPMYDRVYAEDIPHPEYKERYKALEHSLIKAVAEREKLLGEKVYGSISG